MDFKALRQGRAEAKPIGLFDLRTRIPVLGKMGNKLAVEGACAEHQPWLAKSRHNTHPNKRCQATVLLDFYRETSIGAFTQVLPSSWRAVHLSLSVLSVVADCCPLTRGIAPVRELNCIPEKDRRSGRYREGRRKRGINPDHPRQ